MVLLVTGFIAYVDIDDCHTLQRITFIFLHVKSSENFCRTQSCVDMLNKTAPVSGRCTNTNLKEQSKQELAFQPMTKDNVAFSNKADQEHITAVEDNEDIIGPETPGMQPLASQAKRGREDGSKFSSLLDSGKRVRVLDDLTSLNTTQKGVDMVSKFEWLDPSCIKDANGRRPDHPLYDRTTLYIPPKVLDKMSASQKQYWSVKCKYMDVVLFFKVVSQFSALNTSI